MPFGAFDGARRRTVGCQRSRRLERILIAGEPATPIAKDRRLQQPAATTPLTGLSIGLLAAGGAVFMARHVAPRLGRVR